MWLDALVAGLVLLFAWLGARRGALASGLHLLSLPVSYGASWLGAMGLGDRAATALAVRPLVGQLLVGSACFLVVTVVIGFLAGRAGRRAREEGMTPGSQFWGGALGVLRAMLVVIPLLWLANLAEGARLAGVQGPFPDLSGSELRTVSTEAVAAGARALGDGGEKSRIETSLIAHPGESLLAMHGLLEDPKLRILQGDSAFWQDIEDARVGHAMARPTWQQLANDRAFRNRLVSLGMLSPATIRDDRLFQAEMARVLAEVGQRVATLRDDPRLTELLDDPEVRRQLQQGDTLALLTNPGFQDLVGRVTMGEAP